MFKGSKVQLCGFEMSGVPASVLEALVGGANTVIYRVLADIVVIVHLLFIVFAV